jgi:hypothetical protein
VSATPFRPEEFSPLEQAALRQWRAPLPAPDFADRVLARVKAEAQPAPPARGRLAVAALALLLLGGLLSMRSMVGGSPTSPGIDRRAGFGASDGGRPDDMRVDVAAFDGVSGQRS